MTADDGHDAITDRASPVPYVGQVAILPTSDTHARPWAPVSRDYLDRRLKQFRPALYAEALKSLPPEDAQDVVQDVVIACLQSFDVARGEDGLANYLFRSLRNRLTFWRRRRRGETRKLEQWARLQNELAEASASLLEMQGELRTLMRETALTPRQEVCLQATLDGYTGKEVAARLGIAESGVTRHRKAAIAHLALTAQRGMIDTSEPGFRVGGEYVSFAALGRVTRYYAPVKLGTALWHEKQARLK